MPLLSSPGPQFGAAGVTISTSLSDSANLARLDAANVFSNVQKINAGSNIFAFQFYTSDGVTPLARFYNQSDSTGVLYFGAGTPYISSAGEIGLKRPHIIAWSRYSDGTGGFGAKLQGAAADDNPGLELVDVVNSSYGTMRAKYKSSDGTAGGTGTATILGLTSLSFKDGLYVGQT